MLTLDSSSLWVVLLVICLCAQMDKAYFEELPSLLNQVPSHFHHLMLYTLAIWNAKLLPTVVHILQKVVECRVIDFQKWLI